MLDCMVRRALARPIDVMHLGRDRVICAFEAAGFVVDPGPESSLATLLEALGGEQPRGLLLTHIHLDHAGATGALVERFPDLPVYVHERGAPHLIDPSRLLASAGRLYGDDMKRLWGEVVPVPESNVRALSGGERIEGFRVAYTPGHASHHVCYLHEPTGDAYVGDMAGVRIPPSAFTFPPTPPPDIDVEAWSASLDLIAAWDPAAVCLTHFGRFEDVRPQLAAVRARLHDWAERVRDQDVEEFRRSLVEEIRAGADEATAESYVQAAPPEQLHAGLVRYWQRREAA